MYLEKNKANKNRHTQICIYVDIRILYIYNSVHRKWYFSVMKISGLTCKDKCNLRISFWWSWADCPKLCSLSSCSALYSGAPGRVARCRIIDVSSQARMGQGKEGMGGGELQQLGKSGKYAFFLISFVFIIMICLSIIIIIVNIISIDYYCSYHC